MRAGRPNKKSLPVNALIEDRRVLVVGGGRVGQRKVELLLEAGATVVLVCPECVSELAEMERAGQIEWQQRNFEDRDLEGCTLVFACTDDKHVNRRVLELSQAAGVFCCCADGNWPDGDFVTPATLRSGNVVVAVSTSGKSCRQARLVKDNLKKHLDSVAGSDLIVLGTSHEYLSSEERAPLHLLFREREAVGGMVRQVWGVHEFFILNTCNRVELVAVVSDEVAGSGILERLLRFDTVRPDCYYIKRGFEAYSHICMVAAGMGSQTMGENHIVAQIKEAVEEGVTFGWSGSIMRELCDTSLHVSKHIRHDVEPWLEVEELEELSVRFMREHLISLAEAHIVVIGTGVIGQGLVAELLKRGCNKISWVYYRTAPALSSAGAQRISVVQLDSVGEVLKGADGVVAAVDAREPVLRVESHAELLRGGSKVLVDLGMPHNIDPGLAECGSKVVVADLDALKLWHRATSGSLDKILEACHASLKDHFPVYDRMRRSIQGDWGDNS